MKKKPTKEQKQLDEALDVLIAWPGLRRGGGRELAGGNRGARGEWGVERAQKGETGAATFLSLNFVERSLIFWEGSQASRFLGGRQEYRRSVLGRNDSS